MKVRLLNNINFFFLLFIIFGKETSAKDFPKRYVKISEASNSVKIDGILDEKSWEGKDSAHTFFELFPTDTIYSKIKTKVKLCFDKNNIYVGAVCYDRKKDKKFIVTSLRRDFSYPKNDAFAVYLCPQNDKTNGFNFSINPLGVQREGILTNGGNGGVTTNWDNKWFSDTKIYEDSYVVEMAIPFKSIRYNSTLSEWGINFSRQDLNYNINSSWNRMPRNFNPATLALAGGLLWQSPPPKAGKNISFIPYIAYNQYIDHTDHAKDYKKPNIGSDFKFGLTSALNLDLTINPDFSQADVDDQVINLDRFEIFFPEKRQFFLENSDLFGNFGFSKIRPFFSRRIGLDRRNGVSVLTPLVYGARLSGKLNPKWRIGVMNIQSSVDTFREFGRSLKGTNYSTIALQRQMGAASNISFIGIHKQNINDKYVGWQKEFNSVFGLDYNFASSNNKYTGKVFAHQSISPLKNLEAYTHASFFSYNTPKLYAMWNHEFVGANYNAELGYVQRTKYWRLEPSIGYVWYPKTKYLYSTTLEAYLSQYTNYRFKNTDVLSKLSYKLQNRKYHIINFSVSNQYIMLLRKFEPFGEKGISFKEGTDYSYQQFSWAYTSDFRKRLYIEASGYYGGYYTGNIINNSLSLSYRFQPIANFSIKVERTRIEFPNPNGGKSVTDLNLISPKLDFSFTKKLFFTTYVQFNDQTNNIGMNMRLQWRFKPMSDLFIVYNRNSYANDGKLNIANINPSGYNPINQSFIIKLTWWLNL